MAWYPVTVEDARAVVNQARMNKAMDADGAGQLVEYFRTYHRGTVAAIRARIANAHTPDQDSSLLPPEFTMLAALRIAAIFLGRPGIPANGDQATFELSQGQKDELKRLEGQLELVAEGDAVTSPTNPETTESAPVGGASPSIIEKTRYWTKCDQDGIGANG